MANENNNISSAEPNSIMFDKKKLLSNKPKFQVRKYISPLIKNEPKAN